MIRWLVQTVVDHPDLSALRPPPGLLTHTEAAYYVTLRSPQRRRDWLLGRWTAKQLVRQHIAATKGFAPAFDTFSVAYNAAGAPFVVGHHPALTSTQGDGTLPIAISISHSHGYACSALASNETDQVHIGVDIELVEPRPPGFAKEFFTVAEQARLNAAPLDQRDLLITALWSAKEATLKASGRGLTVDPRQVECILHPARPCHWTSLRASFRPTLRAQMEISTPLCTWWRVLNNRLRPSAEFVLTLAAYGANL